MEGAMTMAKQRVKTKIDFKKIPACQGYIIVDPKKCCGCQSCMMACALVHSGGVNTKIARIQVLQNSYGKYPDDIEVAQCRQCVYPACFVACPAPDALFIDIKNGNVRRIDESECIGCQLCIPACPYKPSRIIWNFEKKVAQKCDLCIDTPYWDERGGIDGRQACVEICPMSAIKFTREIPTQIGDIGYKVNLKEEGWPMDRS
jgi:protein NrfC